MGYQTDQFRTESYRAFVLDLEKFRMKDFHRAQVVQRYLQKAGLLPANYETELDRCRVELEGRKDLVVENTARITFPEMKIRS